jgi:hypothetical protein
LSGQTGPIEQAPGLETGIRTFTRVNRPAIEATLLAHVLRDASGAAARLLLAEGESELFSSPAAIRLWQELVTWQETTTDEHEISPARFVQDRWHTQEGSFREYASELMTKEVVPEQTDFAKVVRDCLKRLQDDRRRHQP